MTIAMQTPNNVMDLLNAAIKKSCKSLRCSTAVSRLILIILRVFHKIEPTIIYLSQTQLNHQSKWVDNFHSRVVLRRWFVRLQDSG